jgi:hypothetical protein
MVLVSNILRLTLTAIRNMQATGGLIGVVLMWVITTAENK